VDEKVTRLISKTLYGRKTDIIDSRYDFNNMRGIFKKKLYVWAA
jgi:hypothetical protein